MVVDDNSVMKIKYTTLSDNITLYSKMQEKENQGH